MVCKHGLDETNCPICRISNSIRPLSNLNFEVHNKNPFKAENPFFKKHISETSELKKKELASIRKILEPKLIHEIPKPNLLNQVPDFGNQILNESFNRLEIIKNDKFGISKKIPLTKPELDLESED